MENNRNIENWLKDKRQSFDSADLPLGHRDLFERKLDKAMPKSNSSNGLFQLKYAAILVVAIGLLSSVFYFNNSKMTISDTSVAMNNEKLEEVENEYSLKIKDALTPVRKGGKYLAPEYRSFLKQLDQLDEENSKLKELLDVNPENQQLMQSLIDNYKKRLQILEQINKYIANNNLNKKP